MVETVPGCRLVYLVRHGEAVADAALSDVGRQQAELLARRLEPVAFAAIHHSPLLCAAQTAEVISTHLPGVPVNACALVADSIPYVPDRDTLTAVQAAFLDEVSPGGRAHGAALVASALEHFSAPVRDDQRELIVTHNFVIGWFVRDALGAPPERWIGLNQYHCGLTVIMYRRGHRPSLISYNDVGHLPEHLRGAEHPPSQRV